MSAGIRARLRARRGSGGLGRVLLPTLVLAVVAPTALAGPVQAAGSGLGRPDAPKQEASEVYAVTGLGAKQARARVAAVGKENAEQARQATTQQTATWPKAGAASAKPAGKGKASRLTAGGLPVTLANTSDSTRIEVLDRKKTKAAGVKGVLLTATAAEPGTAEIGVDYSAFASAYGGDWAGRLRLYRLPACALTTPDKPACRERTPLDSHNDVSGRTVSAEVALTGTSTGTASSRAEASSVVTPASFSSVTTAAAATDSSAATVLALVATTGASTSGSGDYTASPLSSSSTWEAGGSSGAFTWSYDMAVPPAAAGPKPNVSLSYDSGSIDGRTASTNNQGSQVGEGFDLSAASYVERSYGSCEKDGQDDKYDLCWKYDNASIVLNGKSNELIKDDTTGVWRLSSDDASTVTHSTGADNGDGNGEYWTVTTGDGTKYTFGLNKLPGAGTDDATDSVWTVPVYGDDSGEPGYDQGSAFADRSVTQAWRWNLDYVVDTHGNAMTYWYTPESNYYAKNDADTATTKYTRGGYLTKILYGQDKDTLFSGVTSDKVTFSYAERCTASDCSELKDSTADNWPDVPYDSVCASGADCDAVSPAFFTRKRLTNVTTHAWSATASAFTAVDSWDLTQEYLDGGDIGDTSDQTLTLKSVRHTGKNGTDIALDPVTFTYEMRPNRVDATDDILPLTRPRMRTVTSETGAITTVTLSGPECVRGSNMPAAEDDNSKSCYPQYWNINGAEDASLDWFHKYRVTAVGTADPTGKNEGTENTYSYADPAWHHNDNPLTPEDERTWSVWRGYGKVTATKGIAGKTQTKTVSLYLQGMDGDKRKDTTATRSVSVAGIDVAGLDVADQTDSDAYAGFLREQITYDGSTPISVTVNDPWSRRTATQHKSYADAEAYYVRTDKTFTHTYLTAKAEWRTRTSATTEWDDYGNPLKVYDAGDTAVTGDETCTRTWYAANPDVGINSLVTRKRVVGRACSTAETDLSLPTNSATRGDVLSDTATVYDGPATTTAWTASQTPTLGEATWTGRASAYPAAATNGERNPSSWQTLSRTTYDALGRVASVADTAGNTSTTSYVPVAAGPLTRAKVTNAKSQSIFTYSDYARGLPTKVYDVNNKITETTYDALGRATATWLPNRSRSGGYSANHTYAYSVTDDAPSWSSTSSLKADGTTYNTNYQIYDSLLRPLQIQTPTPQGGRLLTDTRYDSRGLAYETYADVFDTTSTPNGTYTRAEYGRAPKQTAIVFDGAERPVSSTFYVYGVQKWSNSNTYTGDSTATTAVAGGSATRTIVDALGRTVETREYAGTSPADTGYGAGVGASYTSTKFTYTRDGKQSTITGPDSSWSYGYDLYGRQTSATDPDKGTATTGYTSLDQVSWTKDAAGRVTITAYDVLGRPTGTWSATASADLTSTTEEQVDANKLTAYAYDTLAKGQLDSSTRYVGGVSGSAYTRKVTVYDSMYRATTTQLVLPSSDSLVTSKAVGSTLTFSTYYNIDGTQQYTSEPAAGGLAGETVDYEYDDLGLNTRTSGASDYLLGTSYSALGQPEVLTLGTSAAAGTKKAYVSNVYEEGTDRLTRSSVTDDTHAYKLQELNYGYDDAGNVTAISDPTTLGGTGKADYQCFTYDGHRRLVESWTPSTADCASSGRTTDNLGGAAPYWTSYTYKNSGLRATETTHTTSATTTRTYCYDSTKVHRLAATTTGSSCTGVTAAYVYDSTGNTTTRPDGTASQALTWSAESRLDTVKEGASTTSHVYDADGSLLIRRNTGGETVLYLGATEVHLDASGSTAKYWAQRYYRGAGSIVALRSNKSGVSTLTWLAADHHGTSSLAVDAATQAVTKRYTTPFGAQRTGGTGTWPDDKAFLGASADSSTGMTHLGAREYDPVTGRFISVDPLLSLDQHQSLNGYTYGNNNPATWSDPTGLEIGSPPNSCLYSLANCDSKTQKSVGYDPKTGTVNPSKGTASTSSTGTTTSVPTKRNSVSGPKWGWLSAVEDAVVDYGSAIFSQPDIWWGAAETAGSMALMGIGGETIIGGSAICLTGVGCVAGAPAVAGGVAMVGVGAGGTADGIGRINDGLGKALREADEASRGRAAQEYGDAYEGFLQEKLGGGGGFSEKGRQFDGAYVDQSTGKGTWYEAKSGSFFENTLKNPKRLSKFYSTEGQKAGIAGERGVDYKIISENEIPEPIANWLTKKGIPWEVVSR
ncbi:RHS repeat-associated core domain-containing protein [Streptomyces sp. CA-210063]|uniref:RHS repeat-associated core domain-containing protein n=1 Tax=Streptomyces sp. CA-210063 TaxID=2801029 RepID=UPI00214C87BF|nr:RHS repeat-associated core domain-containing protein [Streptomyces sp. CA-210063]UUU31892.1 RHS repeat-associated core domain-containing protein [Streptomyces sp. CA-210063]